MRTNFLRAGILQIFVAQLPSRKFYEGKAAGLRGESEAGIFMKKAHTGGSGKVVSLQPAARFLPGWNRCGEKIRPLILIF